MATRDSSAIERILRQVLVPLCALAGVVVASGFFFPGFVGDVVSGQGWLVVSLLFFGSGLGYVAILPGREYDGGKDEALYLLKIHRAGLAENLRSFLARHDPLKFWLPLVGLVGFFLAVGLVPSAMRTALGGVRSFVTHYFGWLFLAVMLLSVLYCLSLAVGRWGDVRLGPDDAEPAYTLPLYFTMFFTAGMAAGIVFFGPAEPFFHYDVVPPLVDAPAGSRAAALGALTYAVFHWGISVWSAYLVFGLPIAYYVYCRGAPFRVSTVLTPFLGVENLDSPLARLVDTVAIFATICAIAPSVALISQQFLVGISFQWGVARAPLGTAMFVTGLVAVFVLSAQSGVHRGIRRLAGLNLALFVVFLVLLVGVGPRSVIVERGGAVLWNYAIQFLPMSLYLGGGFVASDWVAGWTVWYWAWWFSWAPFGGLFLAALSRGRTIRTVILTGLVATSVATLVWFVLIGTTALHFQRAGVADVMAAIETHGSEAVAGFPVFEALPMSPLLMFLFLALIIVFMVTSADSSTLVVSILATKRRHEPTVATIVFWGAVLGGVALAALLTRSGRALQSTAVLTGGVFAVLAVVAIIGLTRALRQRDDAS